MYVCMYVYIYIYINTNIVFVMLRSGYVFIIVFCCMLFIRLLLCKYRCLYVLFFVLHYLVYVFSLFP